MDENTNQPVLRDKTWLAAILAIVLVIPAIFLAGIVVVIYIFGLRMYGVDEIQYMGSIALIWFPELLRGMLTGALAIGITRSIIKKCRINVVRYSVLVFWGIITIAMLVINIKLRWMVHKESEITINDISMVINLIGLPGGLWTISGGEFVDETPPYLKGEKL